MGLLDKNINLQMGDTTGGKDNAWQEISGKYASAPPDDGALPQIVFDDGDNIAVNVEPQVQVQNQTPPVNQVAPASGQQAPAEETSAVKSQFNLMPNADKEADDKLLSDIGTPVFKDSIIDIDQDFAKERATLQDDLAVSVEQAAGKLKDVDTIDPTRPTILIVDDSEDILKKYVQIFLRSDYNVVTATDGLEGLDKITKIKPELIFTGIIMPRMDGFAMIEAMRKNATVMNTPVVILSHLGRSQDKERAKELEVRDFIVVGTISPEEIVNYAHSILTVKEYAFPIDLSLPVYAGLVKDLGGIEGISCPDGKTHVLRVSLDSKNDMKVSGRIECV